MILSSQIITLLQEFRSKLLALLVKYFPSLETLTDELIKVIEDAKTEYDLGTNNLILDFGACKAGK